MQTFFLILGAVFYLIGVFIKWYMIVSQIQPLHKQSYYESKYPFLTSILPWNIPFGILFLIAGCIGLSNIL
jgi:hypothetical protein